MPQTLVVTIEPIITFTATYLSFLKIKAEKIESGASINKAVSFVVFKYTPVVKSLNISLFDFIFTSALKIKV